MSQTFRQCLKIVLDFPQGWNDHSDSLSCFSLTSEQACTGNMALPSDTPLWGSGDRFSPGVAVDGARVLRMAPLVQGAARNLQSVKVEAVSLHCSSLPCLLSINQLWGSCLPLLQHLGFRRTPLRQALLFELECPDQENELTTPFS